MLLGNNLTYSSFCHSLWCILGNLNCATPPQSPPDKLRPTCNAPNQFSETYICVILEVVVVLTLYFNPKINKTLHSQAVSHQVINGGRCLDGEKCLCEKAAELVISEEGKDISVVERVILEFDIHRGAKSRVWTHVDFKQITNQ